MYCVRGFKIRMDFGPSASRLNAAGNFKLQGLRDKGKGKGFKCVEYSPEVEYRNMEID